MLWKHGLGLNPHTDNKPGVAICSSAATVPWSGGRRITASCWGLLSSHKIQWRSCLDGTRCGIIKQDPLLSPVSVLVNIAAHINHIPIPHLHTCKTSQIIPSKWIHLDFIDRHALTKLDELWYLNLYVYMTDTCGHKCHSAHMEVKGQAFCRIGSLLPLYVGPGHQACLSSACTSRTISSARSKFNSYRQDGLLRKGEPELSLRDPQVWRTELIPAVALWPSACVL